MTSRSCPTFAVLNVPDHASAIDIADLQAREFGAADAVP